MGESRPLKSHRTRFTLSNGGPVESSSPFRVSCGDGGRHADGAVEDIPSADRVGRRQARETAVPVRCRSHNPPDVHFSRDRRRDRPTTPDLPLLEDGRDACTGYAVLSIILTPATGTFRAGPFSKGDRRVPDRRRLTTGGSGRTGARSRSGRPSDRPRAARRAMERRSSVRSSIRVH